MQRGKNSVWAKYMGGPRGQKSVWAMAHTAHTVPAPMPINNIKNNIVFLSLKASEEEDSS